MRDCDDYAMAEEWGIKRGVAVKLLPKITKHDIFCVCKLRLIEYDLFKDKGTHVKFGGRKGLWPTALVLAKVCI